MTDADTSNFMCYISIRLLINCILKLYPEFYTSTYIDSGNVKWNTKSTNYQAPINTWLFKSLLGSMSDRNMNSMGKG